MFHIEIVRTHLSHYDRGMSVTATLTLKAPRDAVGLAVLSTKRYARGPGIGGLIAVEQGASFLILWNVLARVAIVALLLSGWFAAGKR